MRHLLVVCIIAALPCAVFGQEAWPPMQLIKPAEGHIAPVVLPSGYASVTPAAAPAPSCDRLEHLLKATVHLEAAGCPADAAKSRQQAEEELKALRREVESLRAEVAKLRGSVGESGQAATDFRQVVIHVKAVEVSLTKLRKLDFDLAKVVGPNPATLAASSNSCYGVVPDSNAFLKVLDALQQDRLAKVLAEPTLVTISGRAASFNSGGEIPMPSAPDDKASVEWKQYGTKIDVAPSILPGGMVDIQLRAEFSELDPQQHVQIRGASVPGIFSRGCDTRAKLRPGQILLINGLVQKRRGDQPAANDKPDSETTDAPGSPPQDTQEEEVELWVVLSTEIVEPVDIPAIRPAPFQRR